MTKYRIQWVSKTQVDEEGKIEFGYGSGKFSKKKVDRYLAAMNRNKDNPCVYIALPVKEDDYE